MIISGGLIKNVKGKATIIGITSWSTTGCPVGRPGVFTNVAKFADWIEEIMTNTSTPGKYYVPRNFEKQFHNKCVRFYSPSK